MFTYKIKLTLIILSFCQIPFNIWAQEHDHHDHGSNNEIGISYGPSYTFGHEEWGSGIHMHYLRRLKPDSKWMIGGGVEYLNADEVHVGIRAGFVYNVWHGLSIGILPGIIFTQPRLEEHVNDKPYFGLHAELIYDLFHYKKFHVGPTLDFSLSKYENHMAVGVHAAYGF